MLLDCLLFSVDCLKRDSSESQISFGFDQQQADFQRISDMYLGTVKQIGVNSHLTHSPIKPWLGKNAHSQPCVY